MTLREHEVAVISSVKYIYLLFVKYVLVYFYKVSTKYML